jgi:hypothetical protein
MLFGRSKHHITEVAMTDIDNWDHEQRIVTMRRPIARADA